MSNCFNIKLVTYSILINTILTINFNFDFVGFGPSRYTAISSSVWTLGLRSFYISDDNEYMILSFTSPSSTAQPDILYKRQNQGYFQIGKIICTQCAINEISFNGIQTISFSKNSTRLFVSNTYFVRIFQKREKQTFYQIQKIAAFRSYIFLTKNDYFLLIKSDYNSQIALLNSSGLYEVIYNVTVSTSQSIVARALSGDGLFMIDNLNLINTSSLNVYGYQNSTYILLNQQNIGMLTSNIQSIVISDVVSPGKYRVIISSTSLLQYYDLLIGSSPPTATLSFVQTVSNQTGYIFTIYLTNNGQYMLYTPYIATQRGSNYFYLCSFDNSANIFKISYEHPGILTNRVTKLYANQNCDFMVVGAQFDLYDPWNPTFSVAFYFPCEVQYCQKCSWIKVCIKCLKGMILLNNACVCPLGYSIMNSTCISCNISSCSFCHNNNTCSSCQATYALLNNSCQCISGWTKSISSNTCVDCNIPNCVRCDRSNQCSLYSNNDLAKQIQNLTNMLNQSSSQTIIIVNSSNTPQIQENKMSQEITQIKLILIIIGVIMLMTIATIIAFLCCIMKRKISISDLPFSEKNKPSQAFSELKQIERKDQIKLRGQIKTKTEENMLQSNNHESYQTFEAFDSIPIKKRTRKRRDNQIIAQERDSIQIKNYSNSIDGQNI